MLRQTQLRQEGWVADSGAGGLLWASPLDNSISKRLSMQPEGSYLLFGKGDNFRRFFFGKFWPFVAFLYISIFEGGIHPSPKNVAHFYAGW